MGRSRKTSEVQGPPPQFDGAASSALAQPALPFPVVCIGASAGGLEAFTQLLGALPANTGMAFVLVSHLSPSHASHLAEILARATRMPVTEVKDGAKVQPNRVYVIPPDSVMIIAEGSLQLSPRRPVDGRHHPIDLFLESLAREQRHKSIAVILSGTGSDGALGTSEVKAAGGITFAQDESAAYEGMPRSAMMAGNVDFRLPPAEIAHELGKIARHAYVGALDAPEQIAAGGQTSKVLHLLHQTTGVDFTNYKAPTLQRRIARRMALQKTNSLADYTEFLRGHPAEIEALFQDILINVTSFFRDAETFELMKTELFPRMTAEHSPSDPIRMWVVGCSTGEEAYSLAIVFSEFMEREGRAWPVQIFATDLNGSGVERARGGIYPKSIAEHVSPERLRRYFYELDGKYRVAKAIRDICVFAKHNVLEDPPFSRMDLLSCRNMLIYLEPVLQQQLLSSLHYALQPSGVLLLGGSDSPGALGTLFEALDPKHRFYTKKPGDVRRPAPVVPRSIDRRPLLPAVATRDLRLGDAVQREAARILLSRYPPAGVLVPPDLDIVQFRGDTSAYLAPASGRASLSLLKMLREGLLVPVRGALAQAKREGEGVRTNGVRVKTSDGHRHVDVEVVPIAGSQETVDGFLVLFHDSTSQPAIETLAVTEAESVQETARLKQELTSTQEYLQSVIEQQEAANEELQSANEEVQSANEELQSINEEIETSKEEIQSSNEELATVNDELQNRNMELSQSNNDFTNLLSSVQIAIVMLGPDLRIRRFTPAAEKLLNLIPSDAGRPIADIKMNLGTDDIEQTLLEVI